MITWSVRMENLILPLGMDKHFFWRGEKTDPSPRGQGFDHSLYKASIKLLEAL